MPNKSTWAITLISHAHLVDEPLPVLSLAIAMRNATSFASLVSWVSFAALPAPDCIAARGAFELNGAFKKDPQRRRPPEPKPKGPLGDPPSRLPVEALPFWRELVASAPAGVLTCADRWAVELAARLMEKAVRKPNMAALLELARTLELSPTETKALAREERISSAEYSILRSLLASIGLTPADRSKLKHRR